MAVIENNGLLTTRDTDGNKVLLYPITKLDNVDGAEDLVHYGAAQELTDAEKVQARNNIGASAPNIAAATGNGTAYTATIPGITALEKGIEITIIPDTTSAATTPNLNVNGLGAKNIKQRLSVNTSLTVAAANASWMVANKPVTLKYDGTAWVTITPRSSADDIYGTLAIAKGGTGATDSATARINLGIGELESLNTPDKTSVVAGVNSFIDEMVITRDEVSPDYTNQVPISEDTDGSTFNGTGYIADKALGNDGSLIDLSGGFVTGFIPVTKGDIIRIHCPFGIDETVMVALYGSGKSTSSNIGKTYANIISGTAYGTMTLSGNTVTWDTSTIEYYFWTNFAWLRVTTLSAETVVTVNEELTESTKETYVINPSVKVTAESLDFDISDKPLSGKTVVCFGDSLFGMYRGDTSAPAYMATYTGATVHNVGFGGCRMAVHPSTGYAAFCMWALAKAIAENDWTTQDAQAASGSDYFPDQLALLKTIDFNAVDMVVIHYGTNDFAAGGGTTIDNADDPDDYTTLCGALRYSVEKLLGAYPKLQIYVSLPCYRFWTEDDVTTYAEDHVLYEHTLSDFVEALRGVAAEYKLPVIDCYNGMGVNKLNASAFLSDGTHHNADGRKLFGEFIGGHLISRQTSGKSGMDVNAVNALIADAIGAAIGGSY